MMRVMQRPLYDSAMHRAVVFAVLLTLGWVSGSAAAPASDRLVRFGELARNHAGGLEPAERVLPALFALVDDEILDSLRSGSPFASVPFIQERMDGFRDAWGGAAFRVMSWQGPGERV